MGYTHYAYQKKELDQKQWAGFITDVKKVLKAGEGYIQYESEVKKAPVANKDKVRFNGIGEEGHETFLMTRISKLEEWQSKRDDGMVFNFCKTAQKAYDVYVVACLVLAKSHFGDDVVFSSDGDIEELQDGVKMVNELCGYNAALASDKEGKLRVVPAFLPVEA